MKYSLASLFALAARTTAFNCSAENIKAFLPANATVFFANHLQASSSFTPPTALNTGGGGFGPSSFVLPKTGCVIQGNVSLPGNTQYSFGLVLPDDWNGRFLTAGNGGFAGSVSWSAIIDAMWYGFAAISTDTGHESSGASWAYRNPDALINWGYRAMHDTVLKGKLVTQGYYGKNISYSYYRGCSAGGKQGLKEAEEFPEDFDGVIAGAPAWWTTHLQLWNMIVGIWNLPSNSSHYIPQSMSNFLADEVIRQCDPQDGVTDGIVMDPMGCQFRPEEILCANNATNTSTCLNGDQVKTWNKLHDDWVEANQTFIFPSFMLGSEWGWNQLVSSPSDLGTTYVQYMLNYGSNWTYQDWNPDIIKVSDKLNPGNATADNYDLTPFYKKGGKLLQYHGLSDWSIATGSSIYFYNQVARTMEPNGIDLDNFYRFYLIPGMGHCAGTYAGMNAPWYIAGDGQNSNLGGNSHSVPGYSDSKHDVLLAMMAWVENGTAPTDIIATKYLNDTNPEGGVLRQRPICVYPSHAVYNGTGDVDAPESWKCQPLY
ncbi:hypothetical protein EG329_003733 [Mollisiaceae sp. DMI_Dod_QoI]|nr:hypothetical protein EG329_003733 [Helotiales sp. DMI_Dod_QoI]